MNVVLISPHFPANFQHFCHRLSQAGIHVFGIDQLNEEELPLYLKESLKGYYKVQDLHHYEELVQACQYFTETYGPIHRLESHNEYWLETQANLASQFQIPGLKKEQMSGMKQKSEMKKIFKSLGFPVAKGGLISGLESALEKIEKLGYPVILKPDIGVGAGGCQKIQNEGELRAFFDLWQGQPYLLEEFIEGEICTFDGLTNQEGALIFCHSLVYSSGIAEVVCDNLDMFYYSLRKIPENLMEMGKRILQAYQVKERFFHFEFFKRKSDEVLIPIEVNMRPPGGLTLDMYNFSCDIDLYRIWAELVAGKLNSFEYKYNYYCMAISRRFKNPYVYSQKEILEKGGGMIVYHEELPPLFRQAMGDYIYLARSQHLEDLFSLQKQIQLCC